MSVLLLSSVNILAHCQIPCGIYDDGTQLTIMFQDIETIEKSMNQINILSKAKEPNYNQLARWVDNKETHAGKLSDSITYYFMEQRIKPVIDTNSPDYKKYIRELTLLHQILFITMQTKQSIDTSLCVKLRELLGEFKKAYMKSDE